MPDLWVRFKRGKDGPDTLTCTRSDGSCTWQRLYPNFVVHDLCHYATESLLGLREGFLGLLAQGWDLQDFGSPWPRGPLPAEAGWAEAVTSTIWQGYLGMLTLDQVMEQLGPHPVTQRRVARAEVERIHAFVGGWVAEWRAVPPGGAMELPFPASRTLARTGAGSALVEG